jgi:hypothetical protein
MGARLSQLSELSKSNYGIPKYDRITGETNESYLSQQRRKLLLEGWPQQFKENRPRQTLVLKADPSQHNFEPSFHSKKLCVVTEVSLNYKKFRDLMPMPQKKNVNLSMIIGAITATFSVIPGFNYINAHSYDSGVKYYPEWEVIVNSMVRITVLVSVFLIFLQSSLLSLKRLLVCWWPGSGCQSNLLRNCDVFLCRSAVPLVFL